MPFHVVLLFVLLLGNVLFRTFTNGLNVLPKALNLFDIPVVLLIFFLSLSSSRQVERPPWTTIISRKTVWFCAVLVLGSLLNYEFAYLPATISQMIMLLLPLLLFLALVKLPVRAEHAVSYARLLKKLIVLEVLIGVLQLPLRIASGDSEAVHGTFPGNAEQYATFLMISSFYLMGVAVVDPQKRKGCIVAILFIQVLNVSIDNKASLLGAVCSIALVCWHLSGNKRNLLRLGGFAVGVGMIGLAVAFAAKKTSTSLSHVDALVEGLKTGQVANLGKVKAYLDIAKSHFASPYMLLVGSGPSTFYSRGCRQFYLSQAVRTKMYLDPSMLDSAISIDRGVGSDSMGGLIATTLRDPYYSQFYGDLDRIYAVGSIQVDSPFSPLAGLLGETGLLGTWLYLGCYFAVFRRLTAWVPLYSNDPNIFPLLITTLGFMVYMVVNSIYGPFLETTRLTTILWSMVALVTIYVHGAERLAQEEEISLETEIGPGD